LNICTYSYEQYIELVKPFHGHIAPGVLIGGFMVDKAQRDLPEGEFFDAISETRTCLPDAIQMLTPCTIGNGWLRIFDYGRFALTLYEKFEGEGVRVFIDPPRLDKWPEIRDWFFKLKPKTEQDMNLLLNQIRDAGTGLCGMQKIRLKPSVIKRRRRAGFAICPSCNESYPVADGKICLACKGDTPYISS